MAKKDDQGRELLFRAGWQGRKVRIVVPLFMAVGLGLLAGSYWTFKYATAAGGVPASFEERLGLSAFLIAIGLLCFVGMWVYGRIYVAEMTREGDKVVVSTVGPVGLRDEVIDVARLSVGKRYSGKWPGAAGVDAPWFTLGVEGWKLPLLMDLQGEVINSRGFEKMFRRRGRG